MSLPRANLRSEAARTRNRLRWRPGAPSVSPQTPGGAAASWLCGQLLSPLSLDCFPATGARISSSGKGGPLPWATLQLCSSPTPTAGSAETASLAVSLAHGGFHDLSYVHSAHTRREQPGRSECTTQDGPALTRHIRASLTRGGLAEK